MLRSAQGYTSNPFDLVNSYMSACIYIWVIRRKAYSLQVITAHTDDGDREILSPKRMHPDTRLKSLNHIPEKRWAWLRRMNVVREAEEESGVEMVVREGVRGIRSCG